MKPIIDDLEACRQQMLDTIRLRDLRWDDICWEIFRDSEEDDEATD